MNPPTAEAESIGVLARTGTWTIDPVHSTIACRVRDMRQMIATIRGRFTDDEGALIKGVRQPLELDGTVLGSGTDRYANDRVAIETQGDLLFGPMPVARVADMSFVSEGSTS